MKILELYAGSRSIGKVAEKLGHEVFSVDVIPFEKIDLVTDIEFLTPEMIPFKPDMIWASPPCNTYSLARISMHRRNCKPLTEFAEKSDRLLVKTLELISFYDCIYYIENPRAVLRKMPFMKNLDRKTIWFCRYGDSSAKPTDIWSNNFYSLFNPLGWNPKTICCNNNEFCHHDRQPRGYANKKKLGVNHLGIEGKPKKLRAVLPSALCE